MEISKEKFGNRFATKTVAFVLCILLIASSLWFFANGWIQNSKPGMHLGNTNYLELITGNDYQQSKAFQYTSLHDLNEVFYGLESARKIDPINSVIKDLESAVAGTTDTDKDKLKGIISRYFEQMSYYDYQVSDLYYIVDGAYFAWMNNNSSYWYQLTGLNSEVVFDYDLTGEEMYALWPKEIWNSGELPYTYENQQNANIDGKNTAIKFFTVYPDQFIQILNEWKNINENNMGWNIEWLNDSGVLFFATDGKLSVTNIPELEGKTNFDDSAYNQNPAFFSARNGVAVSVTDSLLMLKNDWNDSYGPASIGTALSWNEVSCFIAYPDEYFATHSAAYKDQANIFWYYYLPFIVCALLAIVLAIMLIVWTGRLCSNGERRMYLLDKFFMEGQVIIIGICIYIALYSLNTYVNSSTSPLYYYWPGGSGGDILSGGSLILIVLLLVLAFVSLWCLLSIVRNLKAKTFVKRSLIGLICLAIGRGIYSLCKIIKAGYEEKNPLTKTIALVVVFWVLTIICGGITIAGGIIGPILLIIVLIAAIYFTAKWVERYGKLRKGIEEVSSGNVNYRIDVPEDSRAEFDKLSNQVNQISKAIETAVENELKNQRLKTDLITNVSHDLKTPLTSIITYTDLLKTEGLKSKNAPDYLDILEEKGQRLKKLTDDLFDAAKASSGDISANMGRVDLLSLVQQEIAETETLFEKNELEVIVDAPDERYYINADGNLMWRVMENVFRNTGKYAQRSSRVYIELRREERASGAQRIVFTMKNISATKLNIPADELMERFQRGDENRTTEGSGLGLAIARDLIRLQKGRFDIVIDGDLFKAVIEMEPFEE